MPREKCDSCGRPLPNEESDAPTGPKKQRVNLVVPIGEEGVLEDLLEQLVEKYQSVWPDDLGPVGAAGWKYRAVSFAAYAALTANLEPSEVGA